MAAYITVAENVRRYGAQETRLFTNLRAGMLGEAPRCLENSLQIGER